MAGSYSKIVACLLVLLMFVNVMLTTSDFRSEKDNTGPQVTYEDPMTVPDTGTSAVTTTSTSVETTTTTTTTEYREEVVLEHPYYLEVDKTNNVVSVYTTNEEGKYEKLVRQMICSTEESKGKFPNGMYQLSLTNRRFEWRAMKSHGEDMYAQYACTISGDFMFHSVPYRYNGDKDSLYEWRYEELGESCTGGCIRLTVECAKWIYDNCPPGTPVCIMRSDTKNPELTESLKPPAPVDGWDPTDPDPNNPYYSPMYDPDTEPKPDKYAPLYDYNFKWAPPCTTATARTTTTTAEETVTTEAAAETTTAAAETTTTTAAGGDGLINVTTADG